MKSLEFYNGKFPEPTLNPKFISPSVLAEIKAVKPSHPLVIENYFSQRTCQSIINDFDKTESFERSYQGIVDKNVRNCRTARLNEDKYLNLRAFVDREMSNAFGVNFREGFSVPPLVNCYPIGVGMKPHHDMVTEIEIERSKNNFQPVMGGDYTIIALLNSLTEQSGGEVNFPDLDITVPCRQGTLLAFRVDLVHQVLPVLKGDRYSLVARVFVNSEG